MIISLLTYEEGYRSEPYYCSEGYPAIGIGKRIGRYREPLEAFTFTCPLSVAQEWLRIDVKVLEDKLVEYDWFIDLNEDRQTIIKSMAYQMGIHGLFKFKRMIAALKRKDFDTASVEALDSRWAKQTPKRAKRHAEAIKIGSLVNICRS